MEIVEECERLLARGDVADWIKEKTDVALRVAEGAVKSGQNLYFYFWLCRNPLNSILLKKFIKIKCSLFFVPTKNEEQLLLSSNKYIKFIDLSLKTVQSSRLNLYSCKYSKRVILNIIFLFLFC